MKLRVVQLVIGFEDDYHPDPADWDFNAELRTYKDPNVRVLSVSCPSIAPVQCDPKWKLKDQPFPVGCSFPAPPTYHENGTLQ